MTLVRKGMMKWMILLVLPALLKSMAVPSDKGCKQVVDLVVVVDGSDSISDDDFRAIRDSVEMLANNLDLEQDRARLGVVVYSSGIASETYLSSDKHDLLKQIKHLPHPKDGTQTDEGIGKMVEMFQSQKREGVPKIGIVITDGRSKDTNRTMEEAAVAHEDGIEVFAVGVSADIDKTELEAIASSADNVFVIDVFEKLTETLEYMIGEWCPTTTSTTTTTTPAPTTTPEDSVPLYWLCDECTTSNGIGYKEHPQHCDKFVQCYYGKGKKLLQAIVRQCPFETMWNQAKLTCDHYRDIMCDKDPCSYSPEMATRPYDVLNSAFWLCEESMSVPQCCDNGEVYNALSGVCEASWEAKPCPPQKHTDYKCLLKNDSDPSRYRQFVQGWGWMSRPCAPGTLFSLEDCGCTLNGPHYPVCNPELYISFNDHPFDVHGRIYVDNHGVVIDENAGINGAGYFDGTSRLIVPYYSKLSTKSKLVITFRYKESNPNEETMQTLVTNGDCGKKGTFSVTQGPESVYFGVRNEDGNLAITSVDKPVESGWKNVVFFHDQKVLTGIVNNEMWQGEAKGRNETDSCALQVGYSQETDGYGWNFNSFTGYIDELYVYQCVPDWLKKEREYPQEPDYPLYS